MTRKCRLLPFSFFSSTLLMVRYKARKFLNYNRCCIIKSFTSYCAFFTFHFYPLFLFSRYWSQMHFYHLKRYLHIFLVLFVIWLKLVLELSIWNVKLNKLLMRKRVFYIFQMYKTFFDKFSMSAQKTTVIHF